MKYLLCAFAVAALCLAAPVDTDLSGKWSGSAVSDPASGESIPAMLILKQSGNDITGSAGPNEDQQYAITKGTRTGDKVKIEVEPNPNQKITLELALEGDHLKGQMTMSRDGETRNAKLDVSRAK